MHQMLRGYVALGAGLAEMARQRLVEVGRSLTEDSDVDVDRVVAAAEPVLRQVQDTAAWLLARGQANREIVTQIVRDEVERTAASLGLVRMADLDDLEDRVDELERSLAAMKAAPAKKAPAKKTAAKKTPAKKAAQGKSPPPPSSRGGGSVSERS